MIYEIRRASGTDYEGRTPTTPGAYFDKESFNWYIRIDSFQRLQNLIELEGSVVLDEASIIIYDDYLE